MTAITSDASSNVYADKMQTFASGTELKLVCDGVDIITYVVPTGKTFAGTMIIMGDEK